MNKPTLLSHLRAIFILPFTVVFAIPFLISYLTQFRCMVIRDTDNFSSCGIARGDFSSFNPLSILGMLFMILGFILFITTIWLFNTLGKGTLAPWQPPQKLVIAGPYRYVRNPMISSLFLMLLGEAMFFYSKLIFIWLLIFMVLNYFFLVLWEESRLVKRFGEEYKHYRDTVPRWIPVGRRYTPK